RRACAGAARRRFGDRGVVRCGQRQRAGDGSHLPGTRRDDRSGDDVRVPGGATHCGEGLMPINLDDALGAELDPVEFSWSSSDVQLSHLGLGAGPDPMAERELRYLVDDTPQVLPTFGNV